MAEDERGGLFGGSWIWVIIIILVIILLFCPGIFGQGGIGGSGCGCNAGGPGYYKD
jgi:hypothetical protein